MKDLIKKLEAATEGSRELDISILKQIMPYRRDRFHAIANLDKKHRYTTSIDAALTLVPEGFHWWLESGNEYGSNPHAGVYHKENEQQEGIAETPALALCIAALKARGEE